MTASRPLGPYVAVCGPGQATDEEAEWAFEVGRLLGEAGAVTVCGGLTGVMDAVARGAAAAGGMSFGLLPGDARAGSSRHLTLSLPTGLGEARNALVVRAADVVIAVSGEYGTLSEIALAIKMGTPVVGLGTWELRSPRGTPDPVVRAGTPQEAVEAALRLAAERRGDR